MLDREQVMVRAILETLPVGVLSTRRVGPGGTVLISPGWATGSIGVDISRGMLAVGAMKLPDAEFHHADWHALPMPDNYVDTVVCGLALAHVRDLGPVFAEFARVMKPGGHMVVSDSRGLMDGALVPPPMVFEDHEGNPGFMRAWTHRTSDYLRAAIALGLQVRGCEEYVSHCDLVDDTGDRVWRRGTATSPDYEGRAGRHLGAARVGPDSGQRQLPGQAADDRLALPAGWLTVAQLPPILLRTAWVGSRSETRAMSSSAVCGTGERFVNRTS